MKALIVLLSVTVALFSNVVLAKDVSSEEMQANFQTCAANSPNWMGRWGVYVVGFDRNTASQECAKIHWNGRYRLQIASCKFNGDWLKAGFYCSEVGGHR
jgi:hypothetical protein